MPHIQFICSFDELKSLVSYKLNDTENESIDERDVAGNKRLIAKWNKLILHIARTLCFLHSDSVLHAPFWDYEYST